MVPAVSGVFTGGWLRLNLSHAATNCLSFSGSVLGCTHICMVARMVIRIISKAERPNIPIRSVRVKEVYDLKSFFIGNSKIKYFIELG